MEEIKHRLVAGTNIRRCVPEEEVEESPLQIIFRNFQNKIEELEKRVSHLEKWKSDLEDTPASYDD